LTHHPTGLDPSPQRGSPRDESAGGSIEKPSKLLGHSSVVMTERYVRLRPDLFADDELSAIPLDLRAGDPASTPTVGETWAAGTGTQGAAP
jgi:hypothetical protein